MYTDILSDGDQPFEEFVLCCARASGAAYDQRDNTSGPVRLPEPPSTYARDEMAAAQERVAEIEAWTPERAQEKADESYLRVVAGFVEINAGIAARKIRFDAMRARVEAWRPPTPDHEWFKRFMLEQLVSETRDLTPIVPPDKPEDGESFKAAALGKARYDVEFHARAWAEDQARYREARAWIRDLYTSLDLAVDAR